MEIGSEEETLFTGVWRGPVFRSQTSTERSFCNGSWLVFWEVDPVLSTSSRTDGKTRVWTLTTGVTGISGLNGCKTIVDVVGKPNILRTPRDSWDPNKRYPNNNDYEVFLSFGVERL